MLTELKSAVASFNANWTGVPDDKKDQFRYYTEATAQSILMFEAIPDASIQALLDEVEDMASGKGKGDLFLALLDAIGPNTNPNWAAGQVIWTACNRNLINLDQANTLDDNFR